MGLLSKFFGGNENEVSRLNPILKEINAFESQLELLTDEELRAKTDEFKQIVGERLAGIQPLQTDDELTEQESHLFDEDERRRVRSAQQKVLDELLPQAFAAVREAAKRSIGQRHYDVQLLGGIVLHQGKITEMKTGEGKTLVATAPLYLNALLGQGAHLITVNDFLAKYHAQWMGRVYAGLGMACSAVEHDRSWIFDPSAKSIDELTEEELQAGLIDPNWPHLRACSRKEAYAADVTYGTNNEFGFDYLRDNMVYLPEQMVQRGHRFAIIDEVDSILIDEARTPLIISAPAEESASLYGQYAVIAHQLTPEEHYKVNEKDKAVTITDEGIAEVEKITGLSNFYDANNIIFVHHLEAALKAEALFKRDKDYVVANGEIVIVDEFTGRLMEGRRYSEGLHQAIEAKEGVEVKRESDTLATISFQNLFRMYDKLSGMTGTAETEAEEFWKIYQLEVVVVPTHRPMVRIDQQDMIYKNENAKYGAVVEDVKQRHENGQPVLIGTISVQKNEYLSKLLKDAGVPHQILNAKQHEKEAQIIAQAGRIGAVTVATNMAGRGVDIILGGMPTDPEQARQVLELGGLHVIGTERHESRRIDNQLRGRAGRQGDPGSSIFYVSMEDDLMRIFGGDRMKSIMDRLHIPDNEPIQHKMISSALESAQKRVEGHNFDIRKHLVEYDDVMNKHRQVIYARRRAVLDCNPSSDDWLHEQVMDMLTDEERPRYEGKLNRYGVLTMKQLERAIYLRVIDQFWIDHLNSMQELREGIGLRGYGQHDPLVEYKHEAYNLFHRLLEAIDDEAAQVLLKAEVVSSITTPETSARPLMFKGADEAMSGGALTNIARAEDSAVQTSSDDFTRSVVNESQAGVQVSVRSVSQSNGSLPLQNEQNFSPKKPGRNDPCPCRSGKKYKKCHGR